MCPKRSLRARGAALASPRWPKHRNRGTRARSMFTTKLDGAFKSGSGLPESKQEKRVKLEIAELKAMDTPPKWTSVRAIGGPAQRKQRPARSNQRRRPNYNSHCATRS